MSETNNCGNCVRMRKTDGWCPMHGFVNALSVRPCFCGEDDTPPPVRPRRLEKREVEAAKKQQRAEDIRQRKREYMRKYREAQRLNKPKSAPDGMKVCIRCGKTLPLSAFGRCSAAKDGYQSDCKECHNAYGRELYERRKGGKIGAPRRHREVPEGMKYCPACGQILPNEQFHRSGARYDGLSSYCKPCMAKKQHDSKVRLREAAARQSDEQLAEMLRARGYEVTKR